MDKIGIVDERFEGGSFEDDDLCLGALLKIALDSFVHHHGHATFTGNSDLSISRLYKKTGSRSLINGRWI
ncbi:hypothetical protein P9D98_18430 [Bacillus mojavensis]|uniref:hypothetical protein n=1 Tax=Bacillus mojavensis TaxID=72360 RepID=UPI002DB71321|nr:hypothetical protein [Bacillus mojavensis]MEC1636583.1 hypothetical protein [Bacillus mojavensis]